MTIENHLYVGMIDRFRVPNRHDSFRFHYVITRKASPPVLMVAGTACTEAEAAQVVQRYLDEFLKHVGRREAIQSCRITSSRVA